jgi:hypothetical protein
MTDTCACLGPQGDCPCIRAEKGLKQKITETFISQDIFDLLSDEDKQIVNSIKQKAVAKFLQQSLSK